MKAYSGTFIKQNGEERQMTFVKIDDLPNDFLNSKIKGKAGKAATLSEGLELVWDIERSEFRIFNWNTVQGDVNEESLGEDSRFVV